MIEWLNSVFSEPKQQAQLVSIVVSAILAIIVVLLNQWFSTKRTRKQLYIEKVESLYDAINEYEIKSIQLISTMFHDKFDNIKCFEQYYAVKSSFQSIEMNVRLHFSNLSFDKDPHEAFFTSINKELQERKNNPIDSLYSNDREKGFYLKEQRRALGKVEENIEILKEMCKELMQANTY
ncbi:hypothetical protein NDJ14_17105 [Vibrio alginolyticus]|nr:MULTISPECIES: hypothetical protein [Vibrio]MCR9327545.1 hypothetical protein [Vibrio alginolyticus]MCS0158648.1 hypothetical protein [Vibrio alginolyticus]MDW1770174.1 hypothetical protein [Vibrio sp. Vb2532]